MTARIPENVPLGCSTVSIIGDTPPRDHHHGRGRRRHHRPHGGAQHRHIRARPAGRRIGGAERRQRQCRADSLPRSPRMPSLCQQSDDRAAAMDCKSTDTNSLESNLANRRSFSLARSKKRPFVHSAALGWQTDARRRAAIRSIAVVAAQGLAIKAVHRPSAASSRW